MASIMSQAQLNRLYGDKLLDYLLDVADSVERLGKEEDPTDQDLIFENIPKGDPNKRIRWGSDKDIDRKQITLRLSVHLGFAKGFLPTIQDGANLVRALKFPLHCGEKINTPLVKKFATMIGQVVDPVKLGPGFVVEDLDKRQGLKRLMVTEETALCVEDRRFHHSALGLIAFPTSSAKRAHRNDLRLDIRRSVLGVDAWVAKVMQELRKHGHLQLAQVPHQFYVDEDVSESDGEDFDEEEESDGQFGSAEDSDDEEDMPGQHARRSSGAAPVHGGTAAPLRLSARQHLAWSEDVTNLRARRSNGTTARASQGTAAPPRLNARQHHEWLLDLQQMQDIVHCAQTTNVPAQHLLAARGFGDTQELLASLRRLRLAGR
ncbi:Hypothetical predicted protein [Lecanosticta acicola]|uniref:Uncharacterized protein n=1 Tax=Lecanosticta acicola TaxID=111012 RepID=A0AAI8Z5B3_9PEZI|nr:Hypothetical predicted protein [Lecanosticta acicola]